MKTNALLLAVVVAASKLHAQGTFQNLDFESVIPPLNRDAFFQVPIANALPGWTGYIKSNQVNNVVYNTRALDAAAISLHDSGSDSLQPIQGNYSVLLQGSSTLLTGNLVASAAIGQTGQIPPTALSLQFFATSFDSLQVSFAGQIIPLTQLGATANYFIMGGDISLFSGQTGELQFTGLPHFYGMLDGIQFSNQAIPEPSVLTLSVLGGLLLGWRWRRGSR